MLSKETCHTRALSLGKISEPVVLEDPAPFSVISVRIEVMMSGSKRCRAFFGEILTTVLQMNAMASRAWWTT